MSLTAATRDRLGADGGVTAIVGDRVYRDERPQGDPLPGVVIFLVSDPRPTVYGAPQALRRSRLQIDCLGSDRASADALAEVVIAAMDDPAEQDGVRFSRAFPVNVRGLTSREPGRPSVFATSVDLIVWWQPAS